MNKVSKARPLMPVIAYVPVFALFHFFESLVVHYVNRCRSEISHLIYILRSIKAIDSFCGNDAY